MQILYNISSTSGYDCHFPIPCTTVFTKIHVCQRICEFCADYQVKVKVPLDNFCPVVFNSRGRCSSPFPSHRASVCPKTIFRGHMASATQTWNAVTFPPRWSLLIYSHLHAFEPLGWREKLLQHRKVQTFIFSLIPKTSTRSGGLKIQEDRLTSLYEKHLNGKNALIMEHID